MLRYSEMGSIHEGVFSSTCFIYGELIDESADNR